MDIYKTIGKNIRVARTKQKVTQKELAKAVGLTRTSVVHIESGRQRIDIEKIIIASNFLGVSIDYLLSLDTQTMKSKSQKITIGELVNLMKISFPLYVESNDNERYFYLADEPGLKKVAYELMHLILTK